MQSHWMLGVTPPTSLGLTFPHHCVIAETLQSVVAATATLKGSHSWMWDTEKGCLRSLKYEIFPFKVHGDLLGYCNLVHVGIYSSTPQLPAKKIIFFSHLGEKWDLLISHGVAFPQLWSTAGMTSSTLPCCLNSQKKVKWPKWKQVFKVCWNKPQLRKNAGNTANSHMSDFDGNFKKIPYTGVRESREF